MLFYCSQNWKHLKVFPLSPLVLRDVTNIPLLPPLSHPKHFESEGMTSFVLIESGNRTQFFFLVHLLFSHLWPLQSGKLLMKLRIFFSTHPWSETLAMVELIPLELISSIAFFTFSTLSLVQVDQIKGCIRPERNFPSSPSASKAPPPPLLRI